MNRRPCSQWNMTFRGVQFCISFDCFNEVGRVNPEEWNLLLDSYPQPHSIGFVEILFSISQFLVIVSFSDSGVLRSSSAILRATSLLGFKANCQSNPSFWPFVHSSLFLMFCIVVNARSGSMCGWCMALWRILWRVTFDPWERLSVQQFLKHYWH